MASGQLCFRPVGVARYLSAGTGSAPHAHIAPWLAGASAIGALGPVESAQAGDPTSCVGASGTVEWDLDFKRRPFSGWTLNRHSSAEGLGSVFEPDKS
jgi:hypothetical protein